MALGGAGGTLWGASSTRHMLRWGCSNVLFSKKPTSVPNPLGQRGRNMLSANPKLGADTAPPGEPLGVSVSPSMGGHLCAHPCPSYIPDRGTPGARSSESPPRAQGPQLSSFAPPHVCPGPFLRSPSTCPRGRKALSVPASHLSGPRACVPGHCWSPAPVTGRWWSFRRGAQRSREVQGSGGFKPVGGACPLVGLLPAVCTLGCLGDKIG